MTPTMFHHFQPPFQTHSISPNITLLPLTYQPLPLQASNHEWQPCRRRYCSFAHPLPCRPFMSSLLWRDYCAEELKFTPQKHTHRILPHFCPSDQRAQANQSRCIYQAKTKGSRKSQTTPATCKAAEAGTERTSRMHETTA